MGAGVGAGVEVGAGAGVDAGTGVDAGARVDVGEGVGVGVGIGVGVKVGADVAVTVGVEVGAGVAVGVGVDVGAGVAVGAGVVVGVGTGVGAGVEVGVGAGVGAEVGVGAGSLVHPIVIRTVSAMPPTSRLINLDIPTLISRDVKCSGDPSIAMFRVLERQVIHPRQLSAARQDAPRYEKGAFRFRVVHVGCIHPRIPTVDAGPASGCGETIEGAPGGDRGGTG